MLGHKILEETQLQKVRNLIADEITEAVSVFSLTDSTEINTVSEINDVFKEHNQILLDPQGEKKELRFIDAIQNALSIALKKYDNLIFMGQDISDYGGVFKITDGFADEFGDSRVRNTPISEAAPLGASLGLTIGGKKTNFINI